MLRHRTVIAFGSAIFTAAVIASSVASTDHLWNPIVLKRVAVGYSNIVPGADGRGAVGIPVTNSSGAEAWVAVKLRPPAPASEASTRMRLEAGRDNVFNFPLDRFPEGDYVITAAVFADSASGDTLEAGSTTGPLTKKALKGLDQWLQATKLP